MLTMSNALLGRSVDVGSPGAVPLGQAEPVPLPQPSVRATERVSVAAGHVERALRALEAIRVNYERLADRLGPERAVKALSQAMSYLDRAEAERRRATDAYMAEATP